MTSTLRKQSAEAGGRSRPLYRQVADRLREAILGGETGPGDPLPSEQRLEQRFGVSRITIRKALDELAGEGLIERQQGRPTRVRHLPGMRPLAADSEGDIRNILTLASETEVEVLSFGYALPPDDIRRRLQLPRHHPALRCERLRRHQGLCFCLTLAWVPPPYAAGLTEEELRTTPLLLLLRRAGGRPVRTEQTISAVAAGGEAARHLEVEEGRPLLELCRLPQDAEGRPIQHLTALFRPDRYRYAMTLTAEQASLEAGLLL